MRPHIVVAPDSFKGTFSAHRVAEAVASGVAAAGGRAELCPVADGGEGTADVLATVLPHTTHSETVDDPLGRPVRADVSLFSAGGWALVEMASASGLTLVAEADRDPWAATSTGTGQLLARALELAETEVVVAVGGSATVDGGAGALSALKSGRIGTRITVLCDVQTCWEDAAAVYGPQKGADAVMVERLRQRMDRQAERLARDPRGVPGTGAGGGLAGALWATLGATLVSGVEWVLEHLGMDDRMARADAAICGEGRLDAQTMHGKAAAGVARRARDAGIPVYAVTGRRDLSAADERALGLTAVHEATDLAQMHRAGARITADQVRASTG